MQDDNEISVEQLEQLLKRKGIPLPFEIGAFIALEVCEQIGREPVHVRAGDVWIGEIGEILVETKAAASARVSELEATRATLALLSDLLVCSAPGVPPMLLELIEHGPSAKDWTLSRLRDDLEACLLPLNRGATRRVLARLLREVRREGDRGGARPSGAPDAAALDAELDNLLGLAPGELPPSKLPLVQPVAPAPDPEPEPEPEPTPEPDTRAAKRGPAIPSLPALTSQAPVPVPAPAPSLTATARAAAPVVEKGPRVRTDELFEEPESRGTSGGMVIGGLFFLIAVVLLVAYLTVGQMGARKLLGLPPDPNAAAAAGPQPSAAAAKPVSGELHITSTPARAQVFLYVGQGPALATDLPMGVAQEFVAIAPGHAPARAVVPAGSAWSPAEPGQAQPRYELAMQAGKQVEPGAETDLGATLLTQDTGTPNGSLGTVRVITTPPGAKVYQLIGFTPDVRVSGLKLDRSYDVIVYLPGYALETRTVQAGDFKGEGSERAASVELTLSKRVKR